MAGQVEGPRVEKQIYLCYQPLEDWNSHNVCDLMLKYGWTNACQICERRRIDRKHALIFDAKNSRTGEAERYPLALNFCFECAAEDWRLHPHKTGGTVVHGENGRVKGVRLWISREGDKKCLTEM